MEYAEYKKRVGKIVGKLSKTPIKRFSKNGQNTPKALFMELQFISLNSVLIKSSHTGEDMSTSF